MLQNDSLTDVQAGRIVEEAVNRQKRQLAAEAILAWESGCRGSGYAEFVNSYIARRMMMIAVCN